MSPKPKGTAPFHVMIALVVGLPLCMWTLSTDARPPRPSKSGPRIDACFSPGGGCESRIVEVIQSADKSIRGQIHYFTSKPIADALIAAHKRGVSVQMILDKSQEKMTYGRWPTLRRAGVDVRFDREHDVNNNKVLILDGRTVITGSYNYTKAAEEKNAENILIVENDEDLAGKYAADFDAHYKHAVKGSN